MNLAKFSIKRPVTTLMIILIIIVLGGISFARLGIDLLPDISLPMGVVVTQFSGASSEEVESMVTKPVEQTLATLSNVKNITSLSSEGSSMVMVEFNWGTNMDVAAEDMREKVDMIRGFLPTGAQKPMVMKFDPTMMPIMQIALYGGDNIVQLNDIAEDAISNRLLRIEGVASVNIMGAPEREISIEVDPDQLAYYGLSMSQISAKLQAENINLPSGNIDQGSKKYILRTEAEFKDVSEIENLPITLPQGGTILLRDVAKVKDANKDVTTITRYNGKPCLSLSIQKQSGYNTVQVAQKVKTELANIKSELPIDIGYDPILDQSDYIQMSISNVESNAVMGGIIAIFVIYLFLQHFRSTLIIGISIPVSIIATFVLIYFSKFTLNMLSLGGLALGVGMLVDSSIVVLDNIFAHREKGEDPVTAALDGTNEVASAVMASTLTNMAVFLPIVFVQGITAQLFSQLALTVTFSLLCALLVSLSVVPLLSSRLMVEVTEGEIPVEKNAKNKTTILSAPLRGFSAFYKRVETRYARLLKWALSHRKIIVIGAVALFIVSIALVPFVGTEFFPRSDAGSISITVKLPYGTNLNKTDEFVTQVIEKIEKIPEIEGILQTTGSTMAMSIGGAFSESSEAGISIKLVPLSEREKSSEEVAEEIRNLTADMAGAEIEVQALSGIGFSGGNLLTPISINIKGDDFDKLDEISNQVVDLVKKIPGTRDVKSSLEEGKPELVITVDRDKASMYGISSAQVAQAVNAAVSGSTATQYKIGGEEIDVVIKANKDLVNDIYSIENLSIPNTSGAFITLSDVAQVNRSVGPVTISRENQTREVTVTGDVAGAATGSVNRQIQQQLDALKLPEGYSIEMSGEQQQMTESFTDLGLVFILAVVLVYMVMASQFESLKQPFIVMFTVPLALIGVVFALFITRRTFNMTSIMGVIILAGVVVNNAIVLLDFVNQYRAKGMSRTEAIIKAGPSRLRPILMTTLTTILGLVPLALGIGEGAELAAPMATSIIGGLTISTVLTLVVIPVVYTIFEDWQDILSRYTNNWRNRRKPADV